MDMACSGAKQTFIRDVMHSYRTACGDVVESAEVIRDLCSRLNDIAIVAANKPRIELFGSHVSGFSKIGADADLSLTYRNFSPWLQGLPRVDEQDSKRLQRFAREAAAAGMQGVRYIRSAIPVVQFVDVVSGIHCDVSIGNVGGVQNSHILRHLRDIFPDFYGAYVHTVKTWAKAREVIAPDKHMFNSFTLTTMALMVLQELGLLPRLDQPSGAMGELTVQDVMRAAEPFALPPIYNTLHDNDEALGEAVLFCLQRFAEYYNKFDFVNGTVSLIYPRRQRTAYAQQVHHYLGAFQLRKQQEWLTHIETHPGDGPFDPQLLQQNIHHEQVQRVSDSPFVVEDFVNFVNCGRRVTPSRVRHVHDEFARLHAMLSREQGLSFSTLCETSNVVPLGFNSARDSMRVTMF